MKPDNLREAASCHVMSRFPASPSWAPGLLEVLSRIKLTVKIRLWKCRRALGGYCGSRMASPRLTDAYVRGWLKGRIAVLIHCTSCDSTGRLKSASTNSLLPTRPPLSHWRSVWSVGACQPNAQHANFNAGLLNFLERNWDFFSSPRARFCQPFHRWQVSRTNTLKLYLCTFLGTL